MFYYVLCAIMNTILLMVVSRGAEGRYRCHRKIDPVVFFYPGGGGGGLIMLALFVPQITLASKFDPPQIMLASKADPSWHI